MNVNLLIARRRGCSAMACALVVGTMLCGATATRGSVVTFQQGVSGYTGAQDTILNGTTNGVTAGLGPDGSNTRIDVYDREHFSANDLRVAHPLISFDLSSLQSSLAAGSTITSATLTLTSLDYAFGTKGLPISLFQVQSTNAGWTEAQADWNFLNQATTTPWAGGSGLISGTDYVATPLDVQNSPNVGNAGPHDGETTTFALSDLSFLPGWINSPSINAGFVLTEPGPNSGGFDLFYSSDATNAAFRPLLTITLASSVPEPAAGVIMLIGGIGLAVCGVLRRRARRDIGA